jgi:O-antigen/teichoic acid export membrane protein
MPSMMRYIRGHFNSSLVINSYLILVMRFLGSATGFIFWAIAARTLSEENVGLASSAIAASALLAGLAQLGLGYGLVRFVANSTRIAALINTTCALVALAGAALSVGFLLGIAWWSPALTPLLATIEAWSSFIMLVITTSMFQLLNWAFLAKRRTTLSLINNTFQSVLNIVLFVVFVLWLPNYLSAVHAYTFSTILSVLLALLLLLPMTGHTYQSPFIRPTRARSRFATYSLSNYVTDQLQKAPDTLMTLIVVNVLGPVIGSYFFVVWSVNAGLRALAGSTATSLLMEGAQRPELITQHAYKSLRLGLILAVSMAVAVSVFSKFILMFYGPDYVERSTILLILLSISLVPNVLVSVLISVLRINGRLLPLILVTGGDLALGLLAVYLCMMQFGLLGVGFGWLLSRFVMVIALAVLWRWSTWMKPLPSPVSVDTVIASQSS